MLFAPTYHTYNLGCESGGFYCRFRRFRFRRFRFRASAPAFTKI